ncbi:MAG: methyltransferase domain-containing protein [bacterium]|nr:methyltransferase domain-containing protein [bacterium]MCP5071657.1 methyltransferase domain-containing protein [bacterium]
MRTEGGTMYACCNCGAQDGEELQVQRGFRILTAEREVPFDIRSVLCRQCGLVFTDPQPDPALLASFYSAQERDAFVAEDGDDRIPGEGSRRDQAAWIEATLGSLSGLRVLEVGCYEGFLLKLLRDRGAVVHGIEPQASAAALARERWAVPAWAGRFEDAELEDEGFDLIVLSHVLEHLSDPRAGIARCYELLAPGGALFIEVPNVLRPRFDSAVDFFTFDHLFNFCPGTLASLLQSFGLQPMAVADDFPFPAFRMVARKGGQEGRAVAGDPQLVDRVRGVLQGYFQKRCAFLTRLRARVDAELPGWRSEELRIAIYGAGYHTECLLDATDLRKAELVALVDGNPAKQGSRVLGLPVVAPEGLAALRPDVIVISSYDFQDEMLANLRRLGLGQVPTLTFYEATVAFSNVAAHSA